MQEETKVERDPDAVGDDDGPSELTIPWQELSPEALRGVIVEFVTREGTEYGHVEVSLDDKIAQVRRQLERREVVVLFDAEAETVNLVTARELARRGGE